MRSRSTRHLTSILGEVPEARNARRKAGLESVEAAGVPRQDTAAEYRALRSAEAFRLLRDAAAPAEEAAAPESVAAPAAGPFELPPELTWHDYAVFLLHIGAEIEHALMVQYLYAAWSLGGPRVPANEEDRRKVHSWRTTILGIAKEEMGHLITVENLLRLIGGPFNFEREDYPFRSEFYPFNFTLQRLTLDSLAKYVVAESPPDWDDEESKEIKERAKAANEGTDVTPVGLLYGRLIELFETTSPFPYLKERDFQVRSLPYQASWDEWGRGYRAGARGSSEEAPRSPDLLILPAASRDQAVAALKAVAEQGEALASESEAEESHFVRFRRVYREMKEVTWEPSRPVALNPKTEPTSAGDDSAETDAEPDLRCDVITDLEAIGWAHLFNIRYRLLLVSLAHALDVAGPTLQGEDLTPRGSLVNWTFGEMYNLRAIGGILVQRPLKQGGDPRRHAAGPPFEMPYTLSLPNAAGDRWRVHRDLLEASADEIATLRRLGTAHADYLRALAEADHKALQQIELLIAASDGGRTPR